MAQSHVLGAANGAVPAAVMSVGEAPGRLGDARTGRCLVAFYHPGRRSLLHRNDAEQRSDWRPGA